MAVGYIRSDAELLIATSRHFQFHKRSQLFIHANDEMLFHEEST